LSEGAGIVNNSVLMTEELEVARNEPHGSPSPTLRDVLAIVFRQRRVAISTFLAVLVLTAVYAWITPAYQAHMKVLLRRGRVDPVVTPEQNSPIELARPEISEEELNSEAELLRDQELLQQVVEENGLADTRGAADSEQPTSEDDIQIAKAVRRLAGLGSRENLHNVALLRSRLGQLRREFDYAVIHAEPVGESDSAALLAHLTDGVVLAVEAHRTRRMTAIRIREHLVAANARLLGVVLQDRTFPIPQKIYRRL
jgi:hypothetical protein